MAENPQVSGQPGDEGELPTPSFSESGTSPTSTDADAIVNKLLEKLTPALDEKIEKSVQSKRDKWIDKIQKKVGGRLDLLAELEEQGVSVPKDVRTEMQIRELQEQISQRSDQPATVRDDGSSTQKQAVSEAIAELKENGLTTDDPNFIEILRGNYKSRAEFDLKVQKYINQKLRPPKPANPADVVQAPAAATSRGSDIESKITQLALMQKTPSKYRAEIAKLTDELDKAGWK